MEILNCGMLGIKVMWMKKIKLIAIIGKAGSGKNTMLSRLTNVPKLFDPQSDIKEVVELHKQLTEGMNERFHFIVPFTTRPQRPGEVDGVDYYFYEERTVKELIKQEKVVQYNIFNNWYYGFFAEDIFSPKINIGIFTPMALINLNANYGHLLDITTIYIVASDKDRLLRQLNREKEPNVKEIIRRYSTDDVDFHENIIKQLPNLIRVNNPNPINDNGLFKPIEEFLNAINTVVNSN